LPTIRSYNRALGLDGADFIRLRAAIAHTVAGMPDHGDYIARHVQAAARVAPHRAG